MTFTTNRDLRNWIADHAGPDATDADIAALMQAIQDDDHPAWGGDWSAYLNVLPDNMFELLE